MTEQNRSEPQQPEAGQRKISLAEAVKQKLAQKKQEQKAGGRQQPFAQGGNQKMKNQNNAKKINTTRKKLGG